MVDKIHEAMQDKAFDIDELVTNRIKDFSWEGLGVADIDEYKNIEYGECSFPFKLLLPSEYAFRLGLIAQRAGIPQSLIVSWLLDEFCVDSWITLVSPDLYSSKYHKQSLYFKLRSGSRLFPLLFLLKFKIRAKGRKV